VVRARAFITPGFSALTFPFGTDGKAVGYLLEDHDRKDVSSGIQVRHGISPSLIFGWRCRMSEGGKKAIRADDEVVAKAEILAITLAHRVLAWATRSPLARVGMGDLTCGVQLPQRLEVSLSRT
jgi:hypothetical protein